MPQLTNKTAIVTGASAGIGYATAKQFAKEGAAVVVGARRESALRLLVEEIAEEGGRAIAVAGDVRDEGYARDLVDTALREFGGVDIGFNNAGILGELGPAATMTEGNWRKTLETNLTGCFFGAKHQIPAMLAGKGGSLIFTSSFVGHTAGMPGTAAYAASKAGLIGLMQTLAAEYGAHGIRANAILPGGTDTMMAEAMTSTPEEKTFVENLHALKRMAKPDEIARTVVHLASDASSFVTGTALLVDGGVSINRT